ncbi:MAG: hypothetical protein ACJ8AW_07605, partial [Rhodopila sp.]
PAMFKSTEAGSIVMLVVFALVPSTGLACLALLMTGLGGASSSTMQATLVCLAAPPKMRSRILGILSVRIGVGPVEFIALGLLADQIGAQWATTAAGISGLLCMAMTRSYWRHM